MHTPYSTNLPPGYNRYDYVGRVYFGCLSQDGQKIGYACERCGEFHVHRVDHSLLTTGQTSKGSHCPLADDSETVFLRLPL